jgi:hypothetical protein
MTTPTKESDKKSRVTLGERSGNVVVQRGPEKSSSFEQKKKMTEVSEDVEDFYDSCSIEDFDSKVEQSKTLVVGNKLIDTSGKMIQGSRQGNKGKRSSTLPPQINTTHVVTGVRRFVANTAGSVVYSVTGNTLAGALGCTQYAGLTARAIAGTARIHGFKIWPSATPTTSVVDVRWTPIITYVMKDVDMVRAIPDGVTNTSSVTFKPPNNSLAGDWFYLGVLGTVPICELEMSKGTIIDLSISYTLSNNSTGATITTAAAAVGTFGYTPLDGTAGGLQPIGIKQQL